VAKVDTTGSTDAGATREIEKVVPSSDVPPGALVAAAPGSSRRGQRQLAQVRSRYEASVAQDLVSRLHRLGFVDTITIFGATFLFSALPLFIILNSFAGRRVEWDLTHHLGLNYRAANVVDDLFHPSPQHSASAIFLGLILAVAGTFCIAQWVQRIYEQVFGVPHPHRGNLVRLLVWIVPFCLWFVFDAAAAQALSGVPGNEWLEGLTIFAATAAFFAWSIHFLLAGACGWRRMFLPAVMTGLFWIGLGWFASIYFSSTILADSRLYGTVGVIFSLLTWFIGIAAVIVLGALVGVMWDERRSHGVTAPST
jgi:membrane protein